MLDFDNLVNTASQFIPPLSESPLLVIAIQTIIDLAGLEDFEMLSIQGQPPFNVRIAGAPCSSLSEIQAQAGILNWLRNLNTYPP